MQLVLDDRIGEFEFEFDLDDDVFHRNFDRRARSGRGARSARPGVGRLWMRWFIVMCLPVMVASATSAIGAWRAPGNLSVAERSVEWLRGHHFGGLVSSAESTYYSHHQPPTGGTIKALPSTRSVGATTISTGPTASVDGNIPAATAAPAPDAIAPFNATPIAGEGVWTRYGDTSNGATALQVAYLRPDAVHGTVTAGVVRIDQTAARFQLVPGSSEPGHGPWSGGDHVGGDSMARLLAAFNSGFRVADSHGAFMMDGRAVGSLRDGAATLIIKSDGSMNVGAWGRDVGVADNPQAIRQNLDLIVDGGKSVPGLDENTSTKWGKTVGNQMYVWRSGIGIDSAGRVIYVGSDGLSVKSLAGLLQRAGAVRAMELDINHAWVSFNVFHHTADGQTTGTKLLAGMKKSANRYLTADSRDFIAVISREALTP